MNQITQQLDRIDDNSIKQWFKKFTGVVFLFSIILSMAFMIPINPNVVISNNGAIGVIPNYFVDSSAEPFPILSTERGETWENKVLSNTVSELTAGLPKLILNNGVLVDTIKTESPTHIIIKSDLGHFRFHKENCSINQLNNDGTIRTTETIEFYHQKDTENPVSDTWVRDPTNDFDCSVSPTIFNSTGIYFTGKKIERDGGNVTTGNEIHLTFKKEIGKEPKWDSTIIVGERVGQKFDKKFMWVQKTILEDINDKVEIIDSRYDTSDGLTIKEKDDNGSLKASGTKFTIDKNSFLIEKKIKYEKTGERNYFHDWTLASDLFQDVAVQLENGKLVTFARYVNLNTLAKGDSISIDPTFGFTPDTVFSVTTSVSANTACNGGVVIGTFSSINMEDSSTSGNCDFFASMFNVTGIPSGSNIRTAQLQFDVQSVSTNTANCDINPMITRPSDEDAVTLELDINNGTAYINNSDFCTSTGFRTITLPTAFEEDCEKRIDGTGSVYGTCSVGFTYDHTSITRDGHDHEVVFDNIRLVITYGTTIPPNVATMNAVTNGSALTVNWVFDSNFDNDTQTSIDNSTIYYGDTKELYQPLHTANATQESNIGAIVTSSNFEAIIHFDSMYEPRGTFDYFTDFNNNTGWTSTTFNEFIIQNGRIEQLGNENLEAISYDLGSISGSWTLTWNGIWFEDNLSLGINWVCLVDRIVNGNGPAGDAMCAKLYDAANRHEVTKATADALDATSGDAILSPVVPFTAGLTRYHILRFDTTDDVLRYTVYSDAERTIQLGTGEQDLTADLPTSLRYLHFMNYASGFNSGYHDNIRFYANVTSPTAQQILDYSGNDSHLTAPFNNTGISLKASHISTSLGNEVQFNGTEGGQFNVTSTSYPEGTQAWTINLFYTPNGTTPHALMSWEADSDEILITIDDTTIELSDAGTNLFNHTWTNALSDGSPSAITIKRSSSGEYCTFVNGTDSVCSTDNTTLGTVTNDAYFIGSNTTLGLTGSWRADEFSVESINATEQNTINYGNRIVPFASLTTVNAPTTTYDDSSVSGGADRCYYVTAWNSIGESETSSIECGTASSSVTTTIEVNDDSGGSNDLQNGEVLHANSTTTRLITLDGTGIAVFTGLLDSSNITSKELVDNYVLNRTINYTPVEETITINLMNFSISCPDNGAGIDLTVKVNGTGSATVSMGHYRTAFTTPVCSSSYVVNWSETFTGAGTSGDSFSTTMIAKIINATEIGADASLFTVEGSTVSTSYSSPKITSSSFTIGSGNSNFVIDYVLSLVYLPNEPTNLNCNSASTTSILCTFSVPTEGNGTISDTTAFFETPVGNGFTSSQASGSGSGTITIAGLAQNTEYNIIVQSRNEIGYGGNSTNSTATTDETPQGGSPGTGAGGGGGGSGGDRTGLEDILLNFVVAAQRLSLGETEPGTFTINWDSANNLQVNRILIKSDVDSLTFNFEIPLILEGDDDGKSSGKVPFTVTAPANICAENIVANCISERKYEVIVEVQLSHEGRLILQSFVIPINISSDPELATYTILLMAGLVTFAIVKGVTGLKSKKSKRGHSKKGKGKGKGNSKRRNHVKQ